ncbi:hypothetical protein MBLNU457_3820t2 [Dothideomycetes sp. NU457]
MFGPLTLLVPPILELSSAATLAYSITSLGLSRRFQTLKSAKELKRIWFKDFWSWFGPRSKKMFAPDVLALLNHAHGTVLEVGPATGIWMEELSQVAATGAITDIYGLEPNLHFFKMDQNRRKFGLEKIYHPINDDISGLESHGIQKGSLDTIITIHVLCSVENPEEVVRELYEYLKSGGQWLVYEHVISDRPIARTWQKQEQSQTFIIIRDTFHQIMHLQTLVAAYLASMPAIQAFQFSLPHLPTLISRDGGSGGCPSYWTKIGKDLRLAFLTSDKQQCNDLARAAVRYAFRDAGTFSLKLPFVAPAAGGADGSILLGPEIDRADNGGLETYHAFIGNKLQAYRSRYGGGIGAADLIQFASNVATLVCPGGPKVKTFVGRVDSAVGQQSPTGVMPPGFGPGSDHDSLMNLFLDKGFSAKDLAALVDMGAHTTSTAFKQTANGIPLNASQDSTPGKWDVKYYAETYNPPPGVSRFASDINLSDPKKAVGKEFSGFVGNQGKWTSAFADAMARMSVLGIPPDTAKNLIDCTGALPQGTALTKRMKSAPLMERFFKK